MLYDNLIADTDSYKNCHRWLFPEDTHGVSCYLESRGGRYDWTVFQGLQGILKHQFLKPITEKDVMEAEAFVKAHGLPFPIEGWMKVVRSYGGLIPINIYAVPEGTVVPVHNVLMRVESMDPELFWLPGWAETALERVWYPTTVATQSNAIRRIIRESMEKTCDDLSGLPFKLHDFGSRGATSREAAAIGGCAHLVNFKGTDTQVALAWARDYYGEDMAGFSIPASEHSTMTSWGQAGEADAMRNMLRTFGGPNKIFACVSDSYDLDNAVENYWGGILRDEVISSGSVVVVRPDSGVPVDSVIRTLLKLEKAYGFTYNKKAYKVLRSTRVIQGDGVNEESIRQILREVNNLGFSTENLAFGMGGALLQRLDRDTQRFAYKLSAVLSNGVWRDAFKAPKTDMGKASRGGRQDLIREHGKFKTVSNGPAIGSELRCYFVNGKMQADYNLAGIRRQTEETERL